MRCLARGPNLTITIAAIAARGCLARGPSLTIAAIAARRCLARGPILALAAIAALGASVDRAHADPWRTTIEVVLRKQPGEHKPAVARLAPGTPVVIEREDGRWLRVRAGKHTGYLTRTTITDDAAAAQPPARAPAARRRWSDGAGALAPRSAAGSTVTAAEPAAPPERAGAAAAPVRPPRGRLTVRADAAIGYRSLGRDFSSNGSAGLANYLVSADATALDLELDVATRIAGARIAADARVELATSSPGPGIDYPGPSRPGGRIPFSTFACDAGVRAGIAGRRFELAARAGVHYDAFLARDVANAGRLPREQLAGATLGVRGELAPPRSRVSVAVQLDALVLGRRAQTPGLEDGSASIARAVWAAAATRILLRRGLSLVSAYELGRATTRWTGMSLRTPGATAAHRVDQTQTVRIGLSAEL